jgi:hypothetical protein
MLEAAKIGMRRADEKSDTFPTDSHRNGGLSDVSDSYVALARNIRKDSVLPSASPDHIWLPVGQQNLQYRDQPTLCDPSGSQLFLLQCLQVSFENHLSTLGQSLADFLRCFKVFVGELTTRIQASLDEIEAYSHVKATPLLRARALRNLVWLRRERWRLGKFVGSSEQANLVTTRRP